MTKSVIAVSLLLLAPCFAEEESPPADATLETTVTTPVPARDTSAESEDIGLEQILRSVIAKSGQIKETEGDIEIARAQLARARAAMWPKGEATVLAAPIFEERGTPSGSTPNWNKWGPFVSGSAQLVQPLFTFGQISGYKRAAENQILARTELAEAKRGEIVLSAKEFYYGYLLASELDRLVDDTAKFLGEAVESAEKDEKKKKKGGVRLHDLYKLKNALEDLRQKKLYATAAKRTAERAVVWVSGLGNDVKIPRVKLVPVEFEKKSLEDYVKLATQKRPEIRALRAGQDARLALRDAKQAQSYPTLFVGGFFSAAWSPVRDRQPSIYAMDPFNRVWGGGGLGLRIDLEFARHAAEASEEAAEAMKLKATESYAVPGIELQVKKAYWEMDQAYEGLVVAERRRALTRKWFVSSAMGWSVGVTAAKDLLEALEGEGIAKKNYLETVYSLNLALGKLSQAVGTEVTSLKYR